MVKKEVIKKINIYLKILTQSGVSIEKAFLFGSYARNEQNDESDIDLMLVSEKFDNPDDLLIGRIWNLTRKADSRIEPYPVGLEKFNKDMISPLLQIVRKEGIQIK
ncbi:MAG TPA: nucleotidyltransferase domain-containing protein [Bacteroidales bacterium]|nr:nucleotidyltransferase domain-containing protein [Bacteroidales bacterium]